MRGIIWLLHMIISLSRLMMSKIYKFIMRPSLELPIAKDSEGTSAVKPMQSPRSRLLLSCCKSMVATACKAYQRVEEMNGSIGRLARGVSHMAAPILNPLELRCFWALTFIDRQITAVQDATMAVFPPSTPVFKKVDELVVVVESFPTKLDNSFDVLRAMIDDTMNDIAKFVQEWDQSEEGDIIKDIKCNEDGIVEDKQWRTSELVQYNREGKHWRPSKKGTDNGIKQDKHQMVMVPEREEQESCMKGYGEECTKGLKQGGNLEGETDEVDSHYEDTMEALESMENASVERYESAIQLEESSRRSGAVPKDSKGDDLLGLFDEAWQLKLA